MKSKIEYLENILKTNWKFASESVRSRPVSSNKCSSDDPDTYISPKEKLKNISKCAKELQNVNESHKKAINQYLVNLSHLFERFDSFFQTNEFSVPKKLKLSSLELNFKSFDSIIAEIQLIQKKQKIRKSALAPRIFDSYIQNILLKMYHILRYNQDIFKTLSKECEIRKDILIFNIHDIGDGLDDYSEPFKSYQNEYSFTSNQNVSSNAYKKEKSGLSRIKSTLMKKNKSERNLDPIYSEIDSDRLTTGSNCSKHFTENMNNSVDVIDRRRSRNSRSSYNSETIKHKKFNISVDETEDSQISDKGYVYAQVKKPSMPSKVDKIFMSYEDNDIELSKSNFNSPNFLSYDEGFTRIETPKVKSPEVQRPLRMRRKTKTLPNIVDNPKEEYINCSVLSNFVNKKPPFEVKSIYRYSAKNKDELSFKKDELLLVLPWKRRDDEASYLLNNFIHFQ